MSPNTDDATAAVAVVTTRRVEHDRVADYQVWSEKVRACLERTPGFISAEQLPAIPGQQDFWTQIVRFSDKDSSVRWTHSPELAALVTVYGSVRQCGWGGTYGSVRQCGWGLRAGASKCLTVRAWSSPADSLRAALTWQ